MTVKVMGAEWKRFYADESVWLDGWFHEDEVVKINGKEMAEGDLTDVLDGDIISVSGGVVYEADYSRPGPSLEAFLKGWRKRQDNITVIVQIKKDLEINFRAKVLEFGGKIIG